MATTKTTCSVCTDRKEHLRALHCLHSYCEECLCKMINKADEIKCPECRKVTSVSHGNIKSLTENFYLNDTQNLCNVCLNKYKTKVASMVCPECSISLCQTCANNHNKDVSVFSDHQLSYFIPYVCELHQKNFQYVCKECGMDMCSLCLYSHKEKHPNHDENLLSMKKEIKNVTDKYRKYIDSAIEKSTKKEKEVAEFRKSLENTRKQIKKDQEKVNELNKLYENLVAEVENELETNDTIAQETTISAIDLQEQRDLLDYNCSIQHPSLWKSLNDLQKKLNNKLKVNEAVILNEVRLKKFVPIRILSNPKLFDESITGDDILDTHVLPQSSLYQTSSKWNSLPDIRKDYPDGEDGSAFSKDFQEGRNNLSEYLVSSKVQNDSQNLTRNAESKKQWNVRGSPCPSHDSGVLSLEGSKSDLSRHRENYT